MSSQSLLSLAELAAYRGQGAVKAAGGRVRYFCPIHGGDKQRSLALDPDTGRFHCFACGAWGYVEERRQQWVEERRREESWRRPDANRSRAIGGGVSQMGALARPQTPSQEPVARPDLAAVLPDLQAALPGSWGARYLDLRRIPMELAVAHGVGFAADGRWPHQKDGSPVRQWKWGRLVFPHTNPAGEVVNLYGRAVGSNEKVPKEQRHDHLPGLKGAFNARALSAETCYITEGVFDALSLMAARYPATCAIFGVAGLRWDWVQARRVVFALDQDQAGQRWRELAVEGLMRGKEVFWLAPAIYGGYKDLNEKWVATGRLEIGSWDDVSGEEWDPGRADALMAGAMMYVADAWNAAADSPDLVSVLELAEAKLNEAYQRQDMLAIRSAAAAVEHALRDGQGVR